MSTWLLMTGYKNKFLKLLFTHPGADPEKSQSELRDLIVGFLEANSGQTGNFFIDKNVP